MINVFIIHGSYGNPEENWFPWMKRELENEGYFVAIPAFPTPEGQKLNMWLDKLKEYDNYFDENTILIGHSMGCALLLRKLELLKNPVKAVFLIGGFTKDLWNGKYSSIIDTFFEQPFDWHHIRDNSKHFEVYQSDNDPLVPVSMGKDIAKNLGVKLVKIKNAGHFNAAAGYTKFPRLLENVKKLL
ncbi:MAG TPA: alpha/beta hydrolase [archaeon]|nr:alpha/beta hydrolase [archaeon]